MKGLAEMLWNPWHGCVKISEGCRHCYVHRRDQRYGLPVDAVHKNKSFYLPVEKKRDGSFKIPPGELVYTCFTSDLFLDAADDWRPEIWQMMKSRQDLRFLFLTKRIDRFYDCIPPDWGQGYPNVSVGCTAENQDRADFRLPIFKQAPIARKSIICEPLLGPVDLSPYLGSWVAEVIAGGESGEQARICRYEWILSLRRQCVLRGVPFHFKQTGAHFVKNEKLYRVPHGLQHIQAQKAGLDYLFEEK